MDEAPTPKFHKRYVAAPSKPPTFDQRLTLIAGRNLYGEPLLKVGWSHDLRMFRNDNPESLKYPGWECWVLEKWVPPTFFEPLDDWNNRRYRRVDGKRIDALGPFPNGREAANYIMATPLANPDGSPVTLGGDVLLWIQMNIDSLLHRVPSAYETLTAYSELQENMAREEEQMWIAADEESEAFGDYVSTHEDEINREKTIFIPGIINAPAKTIWTPAGEHTLS